MLSWNLECKTIVNCPLSLLDFLQSIYLIFSLSMAVVAGPLLHTNSTGNVQPTLSMTCDSPYSLRDSHSVKGQLAAHVTPSENVQHMMELYF
jgi:hypothetical protein